MSAALGTSHRIPQVWGAHRSSAAIRYRDVRVDYSHSAAVCGSNVLLVNNNQRDVVPDDGALSV